MASYDKRRRRGPARNTNGKRDLTYWLRRTPKHPHNAAKRGLHNREEPKAGTRDSRAYTSLARGIEPSSTPGYQSGPRNNSDASTLEAETLGSPETSGIGNAPVELGNSPSEVKVLERLRSPYVEMVEGYLLDVKYDGALGKAVALVLDRQSGRIVRWVDRTGHKPYFLVNVPPEEAGAPARGVSRHEAFERFDVVVKLDPITRKKVAMTKVVVNNPLAVRSLRERFKGPGEGAWEADIRYHHNYVYDNKLIPGMPYRVSTKWESLGWDLESVDKEKLSLVIGSDADEERYKNAAVWLPIFEVPPPEPCIASLDIEVFTPSKGRVPDPNQAMYPIISVAVSRSNGTSKVFLLAGSWERFEELPDDVEVELYDDEAALVLESLMYAAECPVLVTFNGDSFDLPYIHNRLLMLGVPRDFIPVIIGSDYSSVEWGVHVDLYRLFDIRALQAYAFGNAYREKTLDEVARALLNIGKIELPDTVSNIPLDLLARYNARDANITLRLVTDKGRLVWNLIVLLMRISKLGIEDVTRTQVSGWIKSLMYWEHRRRGYLIPRKADIEKIGSKLTTRAIIKDKKYKGALVLEPPVGVFFNIVVLDFASLYPSIIKNWNLSYETVDNNSCPGGGLEKLPGVDHYVCKSIRGITSEIVGLLRDFRVKIYKRKAKDPSLPPAEREWFNVVQASMKVIINASYGVFGNEQFNFFSLALAESVTGIGRTILLDSLRKAEELRLHILYGDTDSLFVWAPRQEALEELVSYVNRKYGLDLEVDKVFKVAVFSGLKKNYIGVTDSGDVIIKGMMGKKRNMPIFIRQAFADAVKMLQALSEPEHVFEVIDGVRDFIKEIYARLRNWEYTLDDLAFHVSLTKDLREYKKNTPQHVKAALQLERYGVKVGRGDIIAFVKVRGGLGVKPVQLAAMREIDTSKYLEHLRSAFEQMLTAFGISWDDITGLKSLEAILGRR
ncbi:MAG: DNA-directed DNA polymerase I [Desulfurococcales archaeon]|nr:DNA-directed DNA polymerase I [Desulfurococcales archaeon]